MYSEDMITYEKDFVKKLKDLTAQKDQFSNDPNYIFDPRKVVGADIYENRSVGDHMVEHNEFLGIVILPEWAQNTEMLSSNEVAEVQFGNYYKDRNKAIPENKWKAPVMVKFSFCSYDYPIGSFSNKLDNYKNEFIDYDEALNKVRNYEKFVKKLLKSVNDYKGKKDHDD